MMATAVRACRRATVVIAVMRRAVVAVTMVRMTRLVHCPGSVLAQRRERRQGGGLRRQGHREREENEYAEKAFHCGEG